MIDSDHPRRLSTILLWGYYLYIRLRNSAGRVYPRHVAASSLTTVEISLSVERKV